MRNNPQGEKKKPVGVVVRYSMAGIGLLGIGSVALSACGSSSSATNSANSSATAQTAATAAKAPLFVDADTVSTSKTADCWLQSQFKIGDKVLFRVKVFNGATGAVMTNKDLQSVVVGLPNGQNLPATYGNHKTDNFWSVTWTIPPSYPTGTIDYTVKATSNSGATGQYVPFKVASSNLTISAAGAA